MRNNQTVAKTMEKQKNTMFKLFLKIKNSWFFLVFAVVLVVFVVVSGFS